jgi:hypothetical protein
MPAQKVHYLHYFLNFHSISYATIFYPDGYRQNNGGVGMGGMMAAGAIGLGGGILGGMMIEDAIDGGDMF